jgi:hypothetical protein
MGRGSIVAVEEISAFNKLMYFLNVGFGWSFLILFLLFFAISAFLIQHEVISFIAVIVVSFILLFSGLFALNLTLPVKAAKKIKKELQSMKGQEINTKS